MWTQLGLLAWKSDLANTSTRYDTTNCWLGFESSKPWQSIGEKYLMHWSTSTRRPYAYRLRFHRKEIVGSEFDSSITTLMPAQAARQPNGAEDPPVANIEDVEMPFTEE